MNESSCGGVQLNMVTIAQLNVNWVKYMLLAWVYLSTRLNMLTGSRDQLNKVFMKLSEKNLLNNLYRVSSLNCRDTSKVTVSL